MINVNTHEAKSKLSALIKLAIKGEQVVICRHGTPLIELKPTGKRVVRDPLTPYPDLACLEIKGDLTAPLSDDEWPEESQ